MGYILVSQWAGRRRILDRQALELCTRDSRFFHLREAWNAQRSAVLCGRDNPTPEKQETWDSWMALTEEGFIELGASQGSRNLEVVSHMPCLTETSTNVL
jgi:hypothetical protein